MRQQSLDPQHMQRDRVVTDALPRRRQYSASKAQGIELAQCARSSIDHTQDTTDLSPPASKDRVVQSLLPAKDLGNQARFSRETLVLNMRAVIGELNEKHMVKNSSHAGVDCRSGVAVARSHGLLRQEGTVIYLSSGTHGVVYLRSNRTNNGKPILGKIYSGFLFDPYRRPYSFSGDGHTIATGWRTRLIDGRIAVVNSRIAELESISKSSQNVGESEICLAEANRLRQRLATLNHNPPQIMHVARHLGDALNAYKGREYPAVDFFLRDVSKRLISAFAGDEDASGRCYATMQSCWDQIVKANGKRGMVRREIWPIDDSESWRIDADQLWALAADNIALTGNAT